MHEVRHARRAMARAARTDALRATFPATLRDGTSYHWITAGDVDAGSFLALMMEYVGHAVTLAVSTWTMSREDVDMLTGYLDEGRVDQLIVLTGEYFAQRETAVYATLIAAVQRRPGVAHLRKLRNHTKIVAIASERADLVLESSANLTTNPRAEQHVLSVDADLYRFYSTWFDEILTSEAAPQ